MWAKRKKMGSSGQLFRACWPSSAEHSCKDNLHREDKRAIPILSLLWRFHYIAFTPTCAPHHPTFQDNPINPRARTSVKHQSPSHIWLTWIKAGYLLTQYQCIQQLRFPLNKEAKTATTLEKLGCHKTVKDGQTTAVFHHILRSFGDCVMCSHTTEW